MSLDLYTPQIRKYLFRLADEVEDANKLNLQDAAVDCENIFRDLFNIIYDYSLENSNESSLNQAVYDLNDIGNKICIQVTSNSKRKVKVESVLKGL